MKLVIGLAGYPLAGKESVGNLLGQLIEADGHSVSRHRFSDILRETLDLWGIPHGRDNEQKMAIVMNDPQSFGEGSLSRAMKQRLMKDAADAGILDGVRWPSDETMLREFPGAGIQSMIVYIDAPIELRYERLRKRNRAGEETLSFERFKEQNLVKTETSIAAIGSRADATLENASDDLAALETKVRALYNEKIRPLL